MPPREELREALKRSLAQRLSQISKNPDLETQIEQADLDRIKRSLGISQVSSQPDPKPK